MKVFKTVGALTALLLIGFNLKAQELIKELPNFTSPVSITTNADQVINFNNTDNSWQYMAFRQSGERKAWMGISSNGNFQIEKEGGNNIIFGGGNVGINTSKPSERLEVAGNIKLSGSLKFADGSSIYSASQLGNWNHTATQNISLGSYHISRNGFNGGISIGTQNEVGIAVGVNNPRAQMEIRKSNEVHDGLLMFSDDYRIKYWIMDIENHIDNNMAFGAKNAFVLSRAFDDGKRLSPDYRFNNEGQIVIDHDGNPNTEYVSLGFYGDDIFGIGIQDYDQNSGSHIQDFKIFQVDVNRKTVLLGGNEHSKTVVAGKLVITDNPDDDFPDYVFEKDYELMPLNELENYVQTEKHLPEIPSAKEVQKNGYDVFEVNKTMLKKIEELTLYIIDQQKQMDCLAEEVEKFKNQ